MKYLTVVLLFLLACDSTSTDIPLEENQVLVDVFLQTIKDERPVLISIERVLDSGFEEEVIKADTSVFLYNSDEIFGKNTRAFTIIMAQSEVDQRLVWSLSEVID